MKFQLGGRTDSGLISTKARAMWDRITFSRLTILYFAFSLIHFAIQVSLQIRAFTINASALGFLNDVIIEGNASTQRLPFQWKSTISLCTWVESDLNPEVHTCQVVWSGDNSDESLRLNSSPQSTLTTTTVAAETATIVLGAFSTPSSSSVALASTTTVFVLPSSSATPSSIPRPTADTDDDDDDEEEDDDDDDDGGLVSGNVTVTSVYKRDLTVNGLDGKPLVLTDTCLEALNWPASQLHNTKREDIVFIAFQFWVLGMSFIALLNESIPHILASLLTHVMVTAWAAFQITHTTNFRTTFNRVITNGACRGSVLLPSFWDDRARAEYPSLALHAVALIISCFLTWKLVKLYGWQTFKRVGASLAINRIYKIVLILSITIQLSLFFMIVTVSLWIDQLFNSNIGDVADHTKLYKASSFITLALLVPWLMMGWFSVRRELHLPMFFFLVLSILYLAGWGVMFFSTTFRWTFVTWRFFSVMACASVFLTCLSFVLGVICRFNFGKGLLRYLHAQSAVIEDDDRSSIWDTKKDVENVPFPSMESVVPTFAAAYGTAETGYSKEPTHAMGPRFFNAQAEPFEKAPSPIASPPLAVTRNLTDIPQIRRSDSNGSGKSHASMVRQLHFQDKDHARSGSQSSSQSGSKRWVIE